MQFSSIYSVVFLITCIYCKILSYNFSLGFTMSFLLQSLVSTQSRLVITSSESGSSADNVLCSDAICVEVPTDDIRVGDSVLVLPGETIPVDVSVSDC